MLGFGRLRKLVLIPRKEGEPSDRIRRPRTRPGEQAERGPGGPGGGDLSRPRPRLRPGHGCAPREKGRGPLSQARPKAQYQKF